MKTILYTNGINKIGKKLENIIHAQVSGTKFQTCNSIELLSQILRQPLNNVSVVILIIDSKEELIQFNLMNTLFDNSRVIQILPDRNKDTLALSLKLKTSFVSYVDSNLQDVASVLKQILKKTKENMQNV